MVDAYYAVRAYDVQRGIPPFEEFVHAPIIRGSRPFKIKIPSIFLPWDDTRGILAIRRRNKILATCRCGVVLSGIYFQHQNPTHQISIALKVMDREQVILQKDDVEGEVRAMAQLQNGGITAALNNRFVLRWEYGEDQYNQYLATEYVANGSLISYASKVIRALVVSLDFFLYRTSRSFYYCRQNTMTHSTKNRKEYLVIWKL
jgi:5'-AMP-activated protein kinase catalytic alpha subunit